MTVVSARVFNQSPSRVKAMTKDGPVFVTDRGRTAVVVLTIEDYERLTGAGSLLDSLRSEDDIDLDPVVSQDLGRVASL